MVGVEKEKAGRSKSIKVRSSDERKTEKKKKKKEKHDTTDYSKSIHRRLRFFEEMIANAADEVDLEQQLAKVLRSISKFKSATNSSSSSSSSENPTACSTSSALLSRSFHLAASTGDIGAVQVLLKVGKCVAVNRRSPTGSGLTALHAACLLRDGSMAALLLRKGGADPCAADASGDTPLDLGLEDLLEDHDLAVAAAEAEARAARREAQQRAQLAAEEEAATRSWAERLDEASAYDAFDHGTSDEAVFGKGWDADTTEAKMQSAQGDWWGDLAAQRRQRRRDECEAEARAAARTANAHQQRSYGPYKGVWGLDTSRSGAPQDTGSGRGGGAHSYPAPDPKDTAGLRGGEARQEKRGQREQQGETKDERSGTQAGPPTANGAPPEADAEAARTADTDAWEKFVCAWSTSSSTTAGAGAAAAAGGGDGAVELNGLRCLREQDVPWPCRGDTEPLPDVAVLVTGERKALVRDLQRRWHPDKFLQRFSSKLPSDSSSEVGARDRILQRVVVVSQAINDITC